MWGDATLETSSVNSLSGEKLSNEYMSYQKCLAVNFQWIKHKLQFRKIKFPTYMLQ